MPKERIGIMGGSFNPIHRRHIDMADCAMREKKLSRILFLPTGNPPHKRTGLEPAEHRYRMTQLAVCGRPEYTASRLEIDRAGTIYTFDTLTLMKKQYPDAELYYLIGEDTMLDLPNWYKPDKVFSLCTFLVFARQSANADELSIVSELRARGAQLQFLSLPALDISSTEVRRLIKDGESVPQIEPQVLEYIRLCGLYGLSPSPENGERLVGQLYPQLNEKRFCHSILVSYTARGLAARYHQDVSKTVTAALLHDCCKCLPLPTLQKLAKQHRLLLDKETMASTLLHGPVGAAVAETDYGISDPLALSAIRYHTTGKVGMLPIDMIVYLADKIEPSRKPYPGLQETRELAQKSLVKALRYSASHFVESADIKLHPNTTAMLDWLSRLPEQA